MSWLPKRDKLDPVQASAIDFVVAQEGIFSIKGEAGTGKSVVLAHAIRLPRLWMVCCAGWLGRSLPCWRRIALERLEAKGYTACSLLTAGGLLVKNADRRRWSM